MLQKINSGFARVCLAVFAIALTALPAFADPPTISSVVDASELSDQIGTMITVAAGIVAVIVVGALAFTLVSRLMGKAGRATGR